MPRAVVISLDRLHLGFVGCYGNDWIETPHLDKLATRSVVFDQHFCENIDPAAANHAWWTGRLQFPLDEDQQRACPTWLDALHTRGVKTHLIAESDGREDTAIAPPFEGILTERGSDGFDVAEGETPIARTVNEAVRWLHDSKAEAQQAVLWIKSRGVPSPWVPPRAFAELYLDEFGLAGQIEGGASEDAVEGHEQSAEETGDDVAAPAGIDESLDWRYAAAMYASYVTLFDRWLGKLLHAVDESPAWKDCLLIVTAGAGQALGEHGRLADERTLLRAESVHTPLWVRLPGSDQQGTRRQALVQTIDLAPTLLEWFSAALDAEPSSPAAGRSLLPLVRNNIASVRDVAWMGSGRLEWGVRTADFFYVEPGDQEVEANPSPARLFEKPHDRWDQFDVAPQFPQVSDDLHEMLRQAVARPM